MATDRKAEPKLTEAAAKTTAVLQKLHSRLNRETAPAEPPDDLGQELQEYFAAAAQEPPKPSHKDANGHPIPGDIRNLVIEGVVNKILAAWDEADGQFAANIKSEVIGRLVEHVVAEVLKKSAKT